MLLLSFLITAMASIVVNLRLGYYGLIEWSPTEGTINQKVFAQKRTVLYFFSVLLFSICMLLCAFWVTKDLPLMKGMAVHKLIAARIIVLCFIVLCILIGPYYSGKTLRT